MSTCDLPWLSIYTCIHKHIYLYHPLDLQTSICHTKCFTNPSLIRNLLLPKTAFSFRSPFVHTLIQTRLHLHIENVIINLCVLLTPSMGSTRTRTKQSFIMLKYPGYTRYKHSQLYFFGYDARNESAVEFGVRKYLHIF